MGGATTPIVGVTDTTPALPTFGMQKTLAASCAEDIVTPRARPLGHTAGPALTQLPPWGSSTTEGGLTWGFVTWAGSSSPRRSDDPAAPDSNGGSGSGSTA